MVSEMKEIMGRWNGYLIVENLDKLKKDPATAVDFMTKVSKVKDKKELQAVLTALLSDPEIKAATKLVSDLNQEIKKTPQQEGVIEDFGLAAGAAGLNLAQDPIFQKLLKYGGPTVALALTAAALFTGGAVDFEMLTGAATVAKASTALNVENGIEIALGSADVVGAIAGKRDEDEDF